MRLVLRLLLVIGFTSVLLAGGMVVVAPQAADVVTATTATEEQLELRPLAQRSIVYAKDGSVLATLHAEENRSPVALEEVPDEVVDAILAIEDENFYEHGGVNLKASFRALFENVSAGEIEQGGSTVTMQLVKNLVLTPEQELDRKVKEIVLAHRLEDQMTKDEILETYLNTVYFGHGAYGVQAAAEIYWQKSVQELGWGEAALLAALIRNPVGYDPVVFPELALERRSVVLDRLVEVGLVSEEQARDYEGQPLPTDPKPVLPPPEDYFVEEVKERLLRDERLGETYQERENAVFRGGLRIHTTIDPVSQQLAEQARANVIGGFEPFTSAMIGIEPSSGAVRMMLGGPGFESFKYNITTHRPGRQTGSSFKTYVLAAALENGYVPGDRLAGGGKFPNPGGEPDPYEISGKGGTIRSITTASSNGGFVRLGQIVGLERVVETAKRMGLTVPLDPSVISMPLGVFDIPPFEMAAGYSGLAYGGIRQEPYFVERVEDSEGNLVFEHQANPTRAVSRQTSCLATDILHDNTVSGTGTRARIPDQPVAGKTGTTEEFTDAWFVGYSPYLVTAVWMGDPSDTPAKMGNVGGIQVFGGSYPAQMWGQFMGAYHQGLPVIEFPECEQTRSGRFIKLGNESSEDYEELEGEGGTEAPADEGPAGDGEGGEEAPPPDESEGGGDGGDVDDGGDGGGGEPEPPPSTEPPPPSTEPPPPSTEPPPPSTEPPPPSSTPEE